MTWEESEIYIARKRDGTIIAVTEYAAREAGLDKPAPVYCPHCFEEYDEEQPLTYSTKKRRFFHRNVRRDCYQDDRTKDRDHPLIQQTVYKQLKNDDRYSQSEIEYPLKRLENNLGKRFDIGAELTGDTDLQGVVVEVQHKCGNFSRRLHPRVSLAQNCNYGVYIVLSPSARYQQWLRRRMIQIKGSAAQPGSYNDRALFRSHGDGIQYKPRPC